MRGVRLAASTTGLVLLLAGCSGATPPPVPSTEEPPASRTADAQPTAVPGPNTNVVIAQLNMWYYGDGCYGGFEAFDCSGKRTSPFEPALGHTYKSSDAHVVQQQIDWAADYGVDAFSLEWTTPLGVGHSLEENIDHAFLTAPNLHRIRWCIFDDFVLRLDQTKDLGVDLSQGIDFDNPKVFNTFVSDFDHFAKKYFGQPQYLKIDGRPVITIFADWNYRGNFAGAISAARAVAVKDGFDPYIVGEEMRADSFDAARVALFDAVTSFNFANPGLPDGSDMGQQAGVLDGFYRNWVAKIRDLRVVGRDYTVGFQPSFGPQEDDRLLLREHPIYVPALSKDQVAAVARTALNNALPVGTLPQKFIWVNTWNDWAEGTTIEPTAANGPKYPAGNYQFDFVEVMREVFGPQTFESAVQ